MSHPLVRIPVKSLIYINIIYFNPESSPKRHVGKTEAQRGEHVGLKLVKGRLESWLSDPRAIKPRIIIICEEHCVLRRYN